jgi:hypothetical protein
VCVCVCEQLGTYRKAERMPARSGAVPASGHAHKAVNCARSKGFFSACVGPPLSVHERVRTPTETRIIVATTYAARNRVQRPGGIAPGVRPRIGGGHGHQVPAPVNQRVSAHPLTWAVHRAAY